MSWRYLLATVLVLMVAYLLINDHAKAIELERLEIRIAELEGEHSVHRAKLKDCQEKVMTKYARDHPNEAGMQAALNAPYEKCEYLKSH